MNKLTHILLLIVLIKNKIDVEAITPGKDKNLFHDINEQLQGTVYTVFTMLKLHGNFTDNYHHKILLTIQGNMQACAENNYKIYKEIRKIAKSDPGVPKTDFLNFTTPLDELAKEGYVHNQSALYLNQSILNMDMSSLEIPDNFEEFVMTFKEFLDNNNVSLDINNAVDTTGSLLNETRRNLKPWKALEEYDGRRLFKGESVKIKKYPFVASIHLSGEFQCVGSILSQEMVITAASCLQIIYDDRRHINERPWDIAVRVGSDFADKYGEWVYVSNVIFHPDYDPKHLSNNLAIIRIKSFLNLRKKNKKIRRIKYLNAKEKEVNEVILIGFGDKELDSTEKVLKLTSTCLNIYDPDSCVEVYTSKYVSKNNFCAGYVTKRSGACQRDVGGPAVIDNVLVGVVSYGPPVCGTPDAPTVFTDLKHYSQWIDLIVNEVNKNLTTSSDVVNKDNNYLREAHDPVTSESVQNVQTNQNEAPHFFTQMPLEYITDFPPTVAHGTLNSKNEMEAFNNDIYFQSKNFIQTSSVNPNPSLLEYITDVSSSKSPATIKTNNKLEAFNNYFKPKNYIERSPVTPNPKIENPKAFKLLKRILRQFVNYYGLDEFYDTSPNHLWSPTTIHIMNHPLWNQSIFQLPDPEPYPSVETTDPSVDTTEPIHHHKTTESLFDSMKTANQAVFELPPVPNVNILRNVIKKQPNSYENIEGNRNKLRQFYRIPVKIKPSKFYQFYPIQTTRSRTTPLQKGLTEHYEKPFFYENGRAKGLNLKNLEKNAQKILENNFMKDYKLHWDDKGKEFVLLLMTRSTTPKLNEPKGRKNMPFKKMNYFKTKYKEEYLSVTTPLTRRQRTLANSLNSDRFDQPSYKYTAFNLHRDHVALNDHPQLRVDIKDASASKKIGNSPGSGTMTKNKTHVIMYVDLSTYNVTVNNNFNLITP